MGYQTRFQRGEQLHLFAPQTQVANVVSELFGLVDTRELPAYYQPTDEARKLASSLVDLAIEHDSDVALVFEERKDHTLNKLVCIVGPRDLGVKVGDRAGASSYLWDQGAAIEHLDGVITDGE